MDFIIFCLLQQTKKQTDSDQTTRPILVFLIRYREYLIDEIKTFGPYPLRAKIFPRFVPSFSCIMKAMINIPGLHIALFMAVTSYYVYFVVRQLLRATEFEKAEGV